MTRRLLTQGVPASVLVRRWFGQPAPCTHPHLLGEGQVTPGISRLEFHERRSRLMDYISRTPTGRENQNHIVILPSASKQFMTHDIPYFFRQNTDFLYLCGFMEPDSILVIESKSSLPNFKSTLFVPRRDPTKELWEGKRSGADGSVELTGVDEAYNIDKFEQYLHMYLKSHNHMVAWYDIRKHAHAEFHRTHLTDFLRENKVGVGGNLRGIVQSLRVVKSQAEIELMEKSCDIAAKAFVEVMRYSEPQVKEAHLFAKMDFECRTHGAEYLAYPPVVAGGSRANTIHYISNDQIVAEGDLVLMDAGCEYHGYASDITRTWPVSGTYSSAQRQLYEALLEVQQQCVSLAATRVSLEYIYHDMLFLIGKQLQRLSLVPAGLEGNDLNRVAREFCPHHIGHYLGMDVHDTDEVSRSCQLQPGMVVTIEPGVYIADSRTDVPKEFRGLGMRIEDDILITTSGMKNLTLACPKHPDDIEKTVQA